MRRSALVEMLLCWEKLRRLSEEEVTANAAYCRTISPTPTPVLWHGQAATVPRPH